MATIREIKNIGAPIWSSTPDRHKEVKMRWWIDIDDQDGRAALNHLSKSVIESASGLSEPRDIKLTPFITIHNVVMVTNVSYDSVPLGFGLPITTECNATFYVWNVKNVETTDLPLLNPPETKD